MSASAREIPKIDESLLKFLNEEMKKPKFGDSEQDIGDLKSLMPESQPTIDVSRMKDVSNVATLIQQIGIKLGKGKGDDFRSAKNMVFAALWLSMKKTDRELLEKQCEAFKAVQEESASTEKEIEARKKKGDAVFSPSVAGLSKNSKKNFTGLIGTDRMMYNLAFVRLMLEKTKQESAAKAGGSTGSSAAPQASPSQSNVKLNSILTGYNLVDNQIEGMSGSMANLTGKPSNLAKFDELSVAIAELGKMDAEDATAWGTRTTSVKTKTISILDELMKSYNPAAAGTDAHSQLARKVGGWLSELKALIVKGDPVVLNA